MACRAMPNVYAIPDAVPPAAIGGCQREAGHEGPHRLVWRTLRTLTGRDYPAGEYEWSDAPAADLRVEDVDWSAGKLTVGFEDRDAPPGDAERREAGSESGSLVARLEAAAAALDRGMRRFETAQDCGERIEDELRALAASLREGGELRAAMIDDVTRALVREGGAGLLERLGGQQEVAARAVATVLGETR